MEISEQFYPLHCFVRHYLWGCRSHGEHVPYIADLLGKGTDCSTPWAELWIGAHPSQSALVGDERSDETLLHFIQEHADAALGRETRQAGYDSLPFLLKVLSCERPLSIQSHPDKANAARLHQDRPGQYPDANHKPEIMIALTRFTALAGFRPLEDIWADVERFESLARWRQVLEEAQPLTLRTLCETLFKLPFAVMRPVLRALRQELACLEKPNERDALCLKLITANPGDRGVLFAYVLNLLTLAPGQSLFIPANVPHAYMEGTGIECMANSDNVIRAGLTPKAVDIKALMSTLVFEPLALAPVPPQEDGHGRSVYTVPVEEFAVEFFQDCTVDVTALPENGGVFLVLKGSFRLEASGRTWLARRGSSWFRPALLREGKISPCEPGSCLVWADGIRPPAAFS